jgi:outer membrane protein assembly factor BamD (BamD/ComL family)
MKKILLLCLLTILLNDCIFLPEMPQRQPGEEQRYLIEGQKAFDTKAYPEAIKLFQGYLDRYPKSKESSMVLQRLGESFEGLLEMEYQRRIKNNEPLPVLPITAAILK